MTPEKAKAEAAAAVKSRKPTRDAEGSIFKQEVERRSSQGKIKKLTFYIARVRYKDNNNKPREKKRRCASYADAVIKRRELREEIRRELAAELEPEKPKLFGEVLDFFEAEFVKAAVIRHDRKVEGYKENLSNIRHQIKLFRAAFGSRLVTRINYDDIRRYKNERLAEPVKIVYFEKVPLTPEEKAALPKKARQKFRRVRRVKTKPREFASVNRELSRLRRIFNIAIRQGWLAVNPFSQGEGLIQASLETERLRICSFAEEKRLLASCSGRREHFKAILIFALDTGMRKSEIFRLAWKDVHFEERRVFVQATTAKTEKSRFVPLTARVIAALKPLEGKPSELVFGIASDSRTAWENALEAAGISGLRFHDLRATAITRMLRAGMRESEVMKISGHANYKTFLKYVRQDGSGTESAADLMDAYLEKPD